MKSLVKLTLHWAGVWLVAVALFIGGGWEEKRELLKSQATDTRLVASIIVYQCEQVQGLFLIPEHSAPSWHTSREGIPLEFYKDSVILSKNGVMKFTVPCPKKEMLARN